MLEIRIHGRGGQGGLVAGRILAAAFAREGKDAMVIPEFKSERRSAPVAIGLRVSEEKILLRSKIDKPDIIILLDESLLKVPEANVLLGSKTNTLIIMNCADAIAQKYKLGPASLPAVGTAMLGAFAKITGLVSLESITAAASESDELPKKENNIAAIRDVYNLAEIQTIPIAPPTEKMPSAESIFLPLSVISLTDTRGNKTGSWRRIRPECSRPEETISTCMIACPIHQDIREWLLAMKTGDTEKAAEIILRHNPLAASVSRVCPIFCERGCQYLRRDFDGPVAINSAERLLGDWLIKNRPGLEPKDITSDKKAAVVGSGPAGLTCAYILRQRGYGVTVFEKEWLFGGLLQLGIPGDRLPKEIVDAEIEFIKASGVEMIGEAEIMLGDLPILQKDYQAIFLSPGLSEGKKIDIAGKELTGVMSGLEFLKKVNLVQTQDLARKRVIIIGAGNTAMDSARIAQKLGAQAMIVYRRKEENMRAFGNEIEEAKKTGVRFYFEFTPRKITQNNAPQELWVELEKGGGEFTAILGCDLVVMAVGQKKSDFFENLLNYRTIADMEKEGIFIGGDLLTGPKNVAPAPGTGNERGEKNAAYL